MVVTSAGLISGRHERDALVFTGVPYAHPPVGPLRYRKPVHPRGGRGAVVAAGGGEDVG